MNFADMPKPLVYSLSAVLLAIGLGLAYQIVGGSELKYDGPLGSIQVGSGESQTTLAEFLNESEVSLKEARVTIDDQQQAISRLKRLVAKYETEVDKLKALTQRLRQAASSSQSASVADDISKSIASLDRSAIKIAQVKLPVATDVTQNKLAAHAKLTSEVKATISKTVTKK